MKEKKMQIRNSTADFLVFTKDYGDGSIEVRVQDHEVWLTQKSLGQLFDVDRSVITKHLKNVFQEGESDETTTCANFAQVADSGRTYHYKLDAFLQFNDAEILHDKGKVTAAIAKAFAESEFEQYRVLQDELYQSDFDRLMAASENKEG